MSIPFNPEGNFIPVSVRLFGPATDARVRLALDTGATYTMVSRETMIELGYDLDTAGSVMPLITASGTEMASVINLERIAALEQERQDFPVLCHTLPSGSPIDGLLGLDFFRGQKLTVDFRAGLVTLE